MYLTEWAGGFPLIFGIVLLFMEVTTHFVSARWLLMEHGIMGEYSI
jgi:hypothetical protein